MRYRRQSMFSQSGWRLLWGVDRRRSHHVTVLSPGNEASASSLATTPTHYGQVIQCDAVNVAVPKYLPASSGWAVVTWCQPCSQQSRQRHHASSRQPQFVIAGSPRRRSSTSAGIRPGYHAGGSLISRSLGIFAVIAQFGVKPADQKREAGLRPSQRLFSTNLAAGLGARRMMSRVVSRRKEAYLFSDAVSLFLLSE